MVAESSKRPDKFSVYVWVHYFISSLLPDMCLLSSHVFICAFFNVSICSCLH